MPLSGPIRDIGNLLAYTLKELYTESPDKSQFRFDVAILTNRAMKIIDDSQKMEDFKRRFSYNDSEIDGIRKIAGNGRSLSQNFGKFIKRYQDKAFYSAGYSSESWDAKPTYCLKPIIAKAFDKGITLGNAQFGNYRHMYHAIQETKSSEHINPKRRN